MVEAKKPTRTAKAKKPEPAAEELTQEEVQGTPESEPESSAKQEELTNPPESSEEAPGSGEAKSSSQMVMVKNLRRLDYVQPSTQIRIHGYSKTLLLDDVWLQMQCEAKLLEKV